MSGCLGRCGSEAPVAGGPSADTPSPAEPVTPADPALAALAGLKAQAASLPPTGDGVLVPEREVFRRDALVLGNQAVTDGRMDVILGVGDALSAAGEGTTASAFLQRAVGLQKPAPGQKDHLLMLAELKRVSGKPLEGASLLERSIDIEPSEPGEYVALSRMYLAADRMGPARAAVTRGQRKHAADPSLAIQAAEVLLVSGDPAGAIAALPQASPGLEVEALRVKAESQLVTGDGDGALTSARALIAAAPSSPWGPALEAAGLRLTGKDGTASAARARALLTVGHAAHDIERVLAWGETLSPGVGVSPWLRRTGEPATPIAAPPTE